MFLAAQTGLDREMQRTVTRADRSFERLLIVFWEVGSLWLWIVGATLSYMAVAAVASVLDHRMLLSRAPGALLRDLLDGVRTFIRLVRDPRVPLLARAVLFVGGVYWVLPYDLLPEWSYFTPLHPWSGLVEDLLVAAVSAKLFLALCPDAVVAEHALAVERRRRRRPASATGGRPPATRP